MLIQYCMQKVCSSKPEEAEDALNRAVERYLTERRWQFAQWWDRYCTPTAQSVYRQMSQKNDGRIQIRELVRQFGLSETHRAIEILQHVGIASLEEEEGIIVACKIQGQMFQRWYMSYGQMAQHAPLHDPILYSRLLEINQVIADKYLAAWKAYQVDLPNYSGPLAEVRGVLEGLIHDFAPKDVVQAAPGFRPESGRNEPTLRQQIRYYARTLYDNDRVKEIVSDYNLLEQAIEQISALATQTHRSTSSMVHETASRDLAYRALKQWDSILAQLLPVK